MKQQASISFVLVKNKKQKTVNKDHGMSIYYLHLLLKIFQQNQFQPLFSFYKYKFFFSLYAE